MVKTFGRIAVMMLLGGAPALHASDGALWAEKLQEKLITIDRNSRGGEVGVFVKDLSAGAEYSFRGEEDWYLASGVKVPIAIELLRQVEAGEVSLGKEVVLEAEDIIDGSEILSRIEPGTSLSVRFLLEQMIIHSDNTATDLIIREVGLKNVNRFVESLDAGFHPITTLADVRRYAYSAIFPKALELKNSEIVQLKATKEKKRVRELASILELDPKSAREKTYDSAFSAYYARNLNSAPLRGYGEMLEKLLKEDILRPVNRKLLLDIMERTATGRARIRAAFHPDIVWAHKTGTQYGRVCDFGYAWPRETPGKKVVIAACARKFSSRKRAERALRSVGEAIRQSGIFPSL